MTRFLCYNDLSAQVAELVDALASGASDLHGSWKFESSPEHP